MPKENRMSLRSQGAFDPEMTMNDFILCVSDEDLPNEKKLKIYNNAGDAFIQTLFLMIFDARDKTQIIHMGANIQDFVLGKNRLAKQFHPLRPKSFEFEAMPNIEVSLTRALDDTYDRLTFDTWDGDFLGKIFSNYMFTTKQSVHFSLEMYLMNYMFHYHESGKTNRYWLEDMVETDVYRQHWKKTGDILYYSAPQLIRILKTNKQYQRKFHEFERKMLAAVRILSDLSCKQQYNQLRKSKKLRAFLDAVKTRSHLPTGYGMYMMECMHALEFTKSTMKKYIQNPKKAPKDLKAMLGFYWMQLLLPFDETKSFTTR